MRDSGGQPLRTMHFFLAALAILFVVLGFTGFAFGGFPTIIFWFLAALCLVGAWRLRSNHQRRRENAAMRDQPR